MTIRLRPQKRFGRLVTVGVVALAAASLTGCQGPFPQSTFDPASEGAQDLDNLFQLIFGLAVVVFVLVEGALVYTLFRFRARPDAPEPKPVHGHTTLEIAWTLAPAFIIALIAIPTLSTIWQGVLGAPSDNALNVEVIGHQWWWEFNYPDLGVRTANELHLPQGRTAVLRMTSADVIHSFWVPRLYGKRDLMLGRSSQIAFAPDSTGEFLGQCAEFCGESHANMRFRVMVQSESDFDQWVTNELLAPGPSDSLATLARQGLDVYTEVRTPATNSCLACHTVRGVSAGVLGPNLTHLASRATIAGGMLPSTPENLARWLRDPSEVKPGSLMPTIELTEAEIDALVAYLRTLR